MPEQFIVYQHTATKKIWLIVMEDGGIKWNDNIEKATSFELSIAALWIRVLQIEEPLNTFYIERV